MRYFKSLSAVAILLAALVTGCNQPTQTRTTQDMPEASVEMTTVSFANRKCPIMGGKPSPDLTAEYEGKTIGFCCDGCPQKWAALSDEEKAEKFEKVRSEEH